MKANNFVLHALFTLLFFSCSKLGIKSGEGFYNHPKEVAHEEDHLIALDIVKGQVISHTLDGGHSKILVDGLKNMPDGVQASRGFLYWTGMGKGGKPVDGVSASASPSSHLFESYTYQIFSFVPNFKHNFTFLFSVAMEIQNRRN